MANKIIMKKSSVAAKIPLSTDLEVGEIAGNLEDQKLYSKKPDGTVVLMGSGLGGSGDVEGPSSATDGAVALFDGTTGRQLKNGQVPGSIYTQNANNVNITGGDVANIYNVAIGKLYPSDFWTVNSLHLETGFIGSNGGFKASFYGNGYRNTSGTWTSLGLNGSDSACAIDLNTQNGDIEFLADTSKASGTALAPTERMVLTGAGKLGLGESNPDEILHIRQKDTNIISTFARFSNTTNATTGFDVGVVNNTGDAILFNRENTALRFATNNSERFRLTPSGDAGLNTNAPTEKFDVNGNTRIRGNLGVGPNPTKRMEVSRLGGSWGGAAPVATTALFVHAGTTNPGSGAAITISGGNTSASAIFFGDTQSSSIGRLQYEHSNNAMAFFTNNIEAMRIDSGRNVLVAGTSSTPGLNNTATGISLERGGPGILVSRTNGTALFLNTNASATIASFRRQGIAVGGISVTSVGTTYNTSSDYRLKNIIGDVVNAGKRIDALKPVEFDWIDAGERATGFLAHQFQEVYPNSVTGKKDEVDKDGKPLHQSMQAGSAEVIADLVAEIKSLRARVAQLEGA